MGNRFKRKINRKLKTEKPIKASGIVQRVQAPDNEKELLKQVPAKVDGTVVGTANMYDDGSVDVIIDEDAPQWAIDKIKLTEQQMMRYSLGVRELQGKSGL